MNWTDKKIEKLKELWEQGDAATEIAKVFDTTKGSIIGKANRLNFTPRKRGAVLGIKHARKSVPRVIEPENPTGLEDLTNIHCRFPLWDKPTDPQFFCGRENGGESLYCQMHEEKTHVKNPRFI